MGVDYRMFVKRKADNKTLAVMFCNGLKTVLDSHYSKLIHCDGRSCDMAKFEPNDLQAVVTAAKADISRCYDGIRENTLKGIMAKSIEVKNAFDDDTALLNAQIEDDMNVVEFASRALGAICAVTEELFRKTDSEPHGDESKPEEEMEKLQEEYASFYNGEGLEGDPYITMDRDVYCVIEANW